MEIIKSIEQMRQLCHDRDRSGKLGFVPTMGYLHQGHLSLVQRSNELCDRTVVSIYVNPAQFGPSEDLSKYPRDLDRDLEQLASYNIDYVFTPGDRQMYPDGYKTWVEVRGLSDILCGASRPGHFKGVATIVLKLIHIVSPDLMFMGIKDFQQTVVLRKMIADLNLNTSIVTCSIVREADGLALSSRNAYLSPGERVRALCLSQALSRAKELYRSGERNCRALICQAEQVINRARGEIDYILIVDADTLEEQETATDASRMLMAVAIGKTRLIDNDSLSA